ncbi:MAG: maleylpyruvate isomerase N-terminal domain-containing protein [Acidimicrobiales bacterium]
MATPPPWGAVSGGRRGGSSATWSRHGSFCHGLTVPRRPDTRNRISPAARRVTPRLVRAIGGWRPLLCRSIAARNADSHTRMLAAALRGESVEQYAGGYEQRAGDIEAGAGRTAAALRDDVRASGSALESAWYGMTPSAWAGHGLSHGRRWPCRHLPFHRWREVEIHHVDLGLGYRPDDWPESYVRRELPGAPGHAPGTPYRRRGPAAPSRLAPRAGGGARSHDPSGLGVGSWLVLHERGLGTARV